MKLAIISDCHLGFDQGREREGDAFLALQDAIDQSMECDAMLIGGDIFDTKAPSNESLIKGMQCFLPALKKDTETRIVKGIGRSIEDHFTGMPVIAIHGNHERRAQGLMNVVQGMEKTGFLTHLHCNGVVLEKNGERTAVQGLGAVPAAYFNDVLKEWSPKPIPGCFNILMVHNIFKEAIDVPNAISIKTLPKGFDLYIAGDLHFHTELKCGDSPLLIPGSTVLTQVDAKATEPRGFYHLDTKTKQASFLEIRNQRPVHIISGDSGEIEQAIRQVLSQHNGMKPIIKIDTDSVDHTELGTKFGDKAFFYFSKKAIPQLGPRPGISMEEQRLSVGQLGKKLLNDNLEKAGLSQKLFEPLFELFLDGSQEKILNVLRNHHKD